MGLAEEVNRIVGMYMRGGETPVQFVFFILILGCISGVVLCVCGANNIYNHRWLGGGVTIGSGLVCGLGSILVWDWWVRCGGT